MNDLHIRGVIHLKYKLNRNSKEKPEFQVKWEIRQMKLEGEELAVNLKDCLSKFMDGILDPDTAGKAPDKYIENLQNNRLGDFSKRYILTAHDADRTIGILICLPDKENVMHIYSLGILPEYRNMGVGSSLLTACINEMLHNDIIELVLDVHSDNTPAYNLYKKFGFKESVI